MKTAFEKRFDKGVEAQERIVAWVQSRGWAVQPMGQKYSDSVPQIMLPGGEELLSPDNLIFKDRKISYLESKGKDRATLHRNSNTWCTGMPLNEYNDCLKIWRTFGIAVCVVFLILGKDEEDKPSGNISGLYGEGIRFLVENEHHRFDATVYWEVEELRHLATLREVEDVYLSKRAD